MKTRVLSGIGIVLFTALVIYLGGITMYVVGAILSVIALKEFYEAVSGKLTLENIVSMVFAVLFFVSAYLRNIELSMLLGMLYMLCNFLYLLKNYEHIRLQDFFGNVFAFLYIVPAFIILAIIRDKEYGAYIVVLIFLSASTTDTFAYFVGKAIGKHKLAPHLSPNKTIEGSVGGSLISTLVFLACALIFDNYFNVFEVTSTSVIIILLVGLLASIVSQLGDLSASAIKRITGIKDYGHLIPGHGGIMDRMDSTLFTAPALYIILYILVY